MELPSLVAHMIVFQDNFQPEITWNLTVKDDEKVIVHKYYELHIALKRIQYFKIYFPHLTFELKKLTSYTHYQDLNIDDYISL